MLGIELKSRLLPPAAGVVEFKAASPAPPEAITSFLKAFTGAAAIVAAVGAVYVLLPGAITPCLK